MSQTLTSTAAPRPEGTAERPRTPPEPLWRTGARWTVRGLLFTVFLLIGLASAAAELNPDLWMHVRVGVEFLHGWSPAHPGTVSAFATNDWHPTQWLSQVAIGTLYEQGGSTALACWAAAWTLTVTALLYLVCRRWAGATASLALTVLALAVLAPTLSGRPQVISIVWFLVMLTAWLRTGEDLRVRWWLVPMFWLWAMLHGMWPLGLGIAAAAIVGLALDRRVHRGQLLRMSAVPVLGFVATFLTPVGPRLVEAVLLVNGRAQYFSEWAAPDFTTWRTLLAAVPLGITFVVLVRRQHTAWFHLCLVGALTVLLVYSNRTVPLALVGSAILLCQVLATPSSGRVEEARTRSGRARRIDTVTVGIGLVVGMLLVPFSALPEARHHTDIRWADPVLSALPSGSVVLSTMPGGSEMIAIYPDLDFPNQGYADMMTDQELKRIDQLTTLSPGWITTVERLDPQVALLPRTSALAYGLVHTLDWQVTQRHGDWLLAAPPG